MENIVLCRIDDRLIHGQVMTAWLQYVEGNHIVIVDDGVSKDEFTISIMQMSVPQGVKLTVIPVSKAGETMNSIPDTDRVIILVKIPEVCIEMQKQGINLKKVVIGGMGSKKGRKKFYKNVSASNEEKKAFQQLIDSGVDTFIQILPEDKIKKIDNLL
ncbi:MAG: PTS sugar transporter subunit IIB [Catenisphaera adipataccumulans]|jgi:D-glucosaminate-specific PTS system IIB component|uniref:PTS sugar transporter subunit IIB n=1 Tax=Catenisphaera adipataccumulans TaxID=700500 RepID=UPI003D92B650